MKKINLIKSKKFVIYAKKISTDDNGKKYQKVRDHCYYTGEYRGAAHNICNARYKTPKEIPVVFHNGSTYDYHFIIKELAEEFEGQFECLGGNAEKYITFSVPIKKELDNGKKPIYKEKFIDSFRFMSIYYQILLIFFLTDFIISNAQVVSLALNIYQSKKSNY